MIIARLEEADLTESRGRLLIIPKTRKDSVYHVKSVFGDYLFISCFCMGKISISVLGVFEYMQSAA